MRNSNHSVIVPGVKNAPGIYAIFNTESAKVYIGSSAKVRNRLTSHVWHLRNGRHHNRHLQAAWDKYGEEHFTAVALEYTTVEELYASECRALDSHKSASYNIREVVESNRGLRHSDQYRTAQSERSRNNWQRKEYREAVTQAMSCREYDPGHWRQLAATRKGVPLSESHKQKMRDAERVLPKRTAEHSAKLAATKAKSYIATSPGGEVFKFRNLREFCRNHLICPASMGKTARGLQNDHKGWRCVFDISAPL